jgi:hypothetical protein
MHQPGEPCPPITGLTGHPRHRPALGTRHPAPRAHPRLGADLPQPPTELLRLVPALPGGILTCGGRVVRAHQGGRRLRRRAPRPRLRRARGDTGRPRPRSSPCLRLQGVCLRRPCREHLSSGGRGTLPRLRRIGHGVVPGTCTGRRACVGRVRLHRGSQPVQNPGPRERAEATEAGKPDGGAGRGGGMRGGWCGHAAPARTAQNRA